jgi:hypothetical protein
MEYSYVLSIRILKIKGSDDASYILTGVLKLVVCITILIAVMLILFMFVMF